MTTPFESLVRTGSQIQFTRLGWLSSPGRRSDLRPGHTSGRPDLWKPQAQNADQVSSRVKAWAKERWLI